MSTFVQIDLKNALVLYAQQNAIDLSVDDSWRLKKLDGAPSGERTGYTSISQVEWTHTTVAKPTEAQLITLYDNWIAANTALETTENTIKTAQTGLKSKIALAEQFASSITALLNATLQTTEDAVVQPTRYNNIKAVMDAQPAAFRNRFNGDLLQEAEITIASITSGQFPAYCRYARAWATQLALLLVARRAL